MNSYMNLQKSGILDGEWKILPHFNPSKSLVTRPIFSVCVISSDNYIEIIFL